eukprot:7745-Hanusia_phi.AAC.1
MICFRTLSTAICAWSMLVVALATESETEISLAQDEQWQLPPRKFSIEVLMLLSAFEWERTSVSPEALLGGLEYLST